MNNYYTKYIKYKSKYLELKGYSIDSISNDACQTKYIKEKGQTGGVLLPCSEAKKKKGAITIATILTEYDCNYDEINKNFTDQLKQFNYHAIKSESITIQNLLDKKFPIKKLKEAGISIKNFIVENIIIFVWLKYFTMEELTEYYAFIREKLLEYGARLASYLISFDIKISIKDFLTKLNFTIEDLRKAGFDIKLLKAENISDEDLKRAGFTATAMRELDYDAKKLRELGYTIMELNRAGFNAADLKGAGITIQDYINEKVRIEIILEHFNKELSLEPNRSLIENVLKDLIKDKARQFRTIIKLDIKVLKNTFNFTNTELIKIGFESFEFKSANIPLSIKDLLDLKYNAEKFKRDGITINDVVKFAKDHKLTLNLKELGYNLEDLYKANIINDTELTGYGFEYGLILISKGNLKKQISGVKNLRDLGYSAYVLRNLDVGADKLKQAGFSVVEIREAGYSILQLEHYRFTIDEIKDAGYNATEFKQQNYNAKQLKDVGFSAANLREAGFSADGLVIAGFSIDDITAAGFNIGEITIPREKILAISPSMDYNLAELIKKFTIQQLKGFGISAEQFKKNKLSVEKLIDGGFNSSELRNVGYTAQQFKAAGFTAIQLKTLGFSIKELKQGEFTNQQLKVAGFNFEEFMTIGVLKRDFDKLSAKAEEA